MCRSFSEVTLCACSGHAQAGNRVPFSTSDFIPHSLQPRPTIPNPLQPVVVIFTEYFTVVNCNFIGNLPPVLHWLNPCVQASQLLITTFLHPLLSLTISDNSVKILFRLICTIFFYYPYIKLHE